MTSESAVSAGISALEQASNSSATDAAGGGDTAGDAEGGSPVNYEEAALLELALEDIDYRLDVGRAGTALCISTRPSGSWSWVFRGEAKWQANILRCKFFDRDILARLSHALAEAAAEWQS